MGWRGWWWSDADAGVAGDGDGIALGDVLGVVDEGLLEEVYALVGVGIGEIDEAGVWEELVMGESAEVLIGGDEDPAG